MAFSTQDTIVAIATPPGRGGIGVVRLSGPGAMPIAQRLITHDGALAPRHATLTTVRLNQHTTGDENTSGRDLDNLAASSWPVASGVPPPLRSFSRELRRSLAEAQSANAGGRSAAYAIDHAVATYFPAPASYTGDDVVELSAHGSPVVLQAVVTTAVACGARLAEPGEFTLRAFLNGRIDLMQAEAVADLIDAATPLQARAAFDQLDGTLTRMIAAIDSTLFDLIARLEASVDFPDEGYHFVEPLELARDIDALIERTAALLSDARRGRLIREGLQVAIVGEPNVGKSSLFNALVGTSRAIVTEFAGTTRDLVTEVVDLGGLRVTLADTAGLRDSEDPAEFQGVERSRQCAAVADLVLVVLDRSRARPQTIEYKGLILANKADLPAAWDDEAAIAVSATTGAGLDTLRRRIVEALDVDLLRDRPAITNVRHIGLVEHAHRALARAREAALGEAGSMPEEFVLADLSDARAALEEVSGRRAPDDLLEHIFARFCIGK
jgi:tRNA modification GTPase